MGFEPTTSCLEGRNSTAELHPHPVTDTRDPLSGRRGIRTPEGVKPSDLQSDAIVHSAIRPPTQSYRWESNPQPTVYKTVALPLCYGSGTPGTHNFRRAAGRRQGTGRPPEGDFTPVVQAGVRTGGYAGRFARLTRGGRSPNLPENEPAGSETCRH